ncbi:hypothetical protein BDZ89DRAFT_1063829 [Hymenopellis radicata]|nr:hypothetical protein BDZ89DRAFT_1063829 [Hymenopellis radicata]
MATRPYSRPQTAIRSFPLDGVRPSLLARLSGHASDYEDEDDDDDDDDGHTQKRGRNDAGGAVRKRKPSKPKLPEAGPFNTEYAIHTHGLPALKKRKDLNVQADYGDNGHWGRDAGLRELFQNVWDGCVAFMQSKRPAATSDDIHVTTLRGGEPLQSDAEAGIPILGDLDALNIGTMITFVFTVKDTLPEPPSLPHPPTPSKPNGNPNQSGKRPASRRRFERKGDCGRWSDPRLLGWISLQVTSEDEFSIELFNLHEPLTLATMTFGATTKADTEELAGEHGDGMKMGINAIKRPEYEGVELGPDEIPDVHYITGTVQWDFAYNDEASLEVRETKADIPFVPGVLVRIVRFPRQDVHIDRFLFLRPPATCMTTELGSVLLDNRLANEIYVKRIHVLSYDCLKYGVNIMKNVSLSRDRDGFHTDYDIAKASYPIWARLFVTDVKAKDLYLELLLGNWTSVEVIYAEKLMKLRELKLIWKHLREQKGQDIFFYCIDSQSDLRITETVLRKKPYGLPQKFYALLSKHHLIQTPEQARTEQFRNLEASLIPKRPLPQVHFTLHLIDAFLRREKEMACYRDAYSFKAAPPNMGIEVDTGLGRNIFINDCTLSYVYVHMKQSECPFYLPYRATLDDVEQVLPPEDYSALSEEHKFPDVGPDFICQCSALHILSLLGQENTTVSQQWKIYIPYTRRNILQTLPRNVRFQALKPTRVWGSDKAGGMQLSWRTPVFVFEFIVTITADVESRTSLLANLSDTGSSAAMEALTEAGAEDSSFEKPFTLIRTCLDTTFNFKDNIIPLGRKYVVQICSAKQGSLYSMPYHFSVPPSPPRSESISVVRHQPDQVLVSWEVNPDEGADAWIVVVRVKDEEVLRKEVSTPKLDEKIEGLSTEVSETDLTGVVVDIYAKSSQCDGLVSPNHASWPADRVSLTPDPPALRNDDEELEYVDNEHSLAMMAANFDQDDDDGDDQVANQIDNNMSVDVGEPECKVEEQMDIPEVAPPTYDDLVAKPTLPLTDDKTYVPLKARFVNKKRLAADNYYTVTLRGSDGREIQSVIYVHTIGIPDDPEDEDITEVFTISQYVPWDLIHRNAPSNGLLQVCHPTVPADSIQPGGELADRARFRISDILDVHSDPVPVSNVDVLADVEGARFCKWKVVFANVGLEFVPVVGSAVPTVPLASLEFGDLSCGIGGASHGFREAGFNLRFGVEREERTSHVFQINCETPVYNESVDSFFGRSWSETPMLEYPLGVLFVNGDADSAPSKVRAHFVSSIQEFRPAYAQKMTRLELSNMEYDAMKLGYSLRSRILDAVDFGVAAHREYLVIMASAPGRNIPDFPVPRQDARLALKDVISDLTWANPTCRRSTQGFGTRFSHLVDTPEWDKPLPETFVLPSKSVRCRHPEQPGRFLSVRELARILSFPDHWTFVGSLEQQYAQLASAIPPRFAQAVAEEVRKALVLAKPDLH